MEGSSWLRAHLPGLSHLDHPGLREGASQKVLDQASDPFLGLGLGLARPLSFVPIIFLRPDKFTVTRVKAWANPVGCEI